MQKKQSNILFIRFLIEEAVRNFLNMVSMSYWKIKIQVKQNIWSKIAKSNLKIEFSIFCASLKNVKLN